MDVLKKLNDFLEEHNEFYSTIERTKDGYIILFADTEEKNKIIDLLESWGVEEFPCKVAFADEVCICDCCKKVLETTPSPPTWQPEFVRVDDEILCADCVDLEEYIEYIKNDVENYLFNTLCTKEDLIRLGFSTYKEEDYSVNYEEDMLNAMEEYEDCVFYCETSVPFDTNMCLFVRNKK